MNKTGTREMWPCLAVMTMLVLGACAAPPEIIEPTAAQITGARRAEAAGNFGEAAGLWEDSARISDEQQANTYRLYAAESWWKAGDQRNAELQLSQVDAQQLDNAGTAQFGLLRAEILLADNNVPGAEHYLEFARPYLTIDQQSRYQQLRERSNRLQTDPSSFALATASAALGSGYEYDTSQGVAILQLLEDVPSGELLALTNENSMAYGLDDWPELTARIRYSLVNGTDLGLAAAHWSSEHPGHVVSETEFILLAERYRQLFSLPPNIAVLLPMEGGLAAAGRAIRDGLISAFLEHSEGVSLQFYPTSEDPQSAISAYFKAMDEGAQWIIGPLRRQAVYALSELGSLGVPVLALNKTSREESPGLKHQLLFSLSLSQEDEARAIARKAVENGRERAIMLTANNAWGQRMEAAFGEEFISHGGSIMANEQFEPSENDHSALLTSLLKIDESKDRKNRVQATLGINLTFEPSRRDDFEMIFLAATPEQGRQIRPQLRFHEAGEKEVYAMSRIFTGVTDRAADQDLNGIYFPSTRWQLSRSPGPGVPELSSLRGGDLAALHALGNDAWNLLPWLPLMHKDADLRFDGATGVLQMNPEGQLLREPAWAQFSNGRPVQVEWLIPED